MCKGEISEEIPQSTVWQDPVTEETFIVDARGGNSYSQNSRHKADTVSMNRVLRIPSLLKKSKDPGQDPCSGHTRDCIPDWLSEALNVRPECLENKHHFNLAISKANNAFGVTEPKIPSLTLFANQAADDRSYAPVHSNNYSCCAHTFGTPYLRSGSSSERTRVRFQKADLLKARVINQVDRKFIACLVDPGHQENRILLEKLTAGGSTLVLIDQHAADERVRVERFLKDICSGFLQRCEGTGGVEVLELSPAVPILLTRHEAWRLASIEEVQSAFDRWGIRFEGLVKLTSLEPEDTGNETDGGYVQVFVQAIPAIVSVKVSLDVCMVLQTHYPLV